MEETDTFGFYNVNDTVILRNAVRCNNCGDIIESTVHGELVHCFCRMVGIDGALDHLHRSCSVPRGYEEMAEIVTPLGQPIEVLQG